MQESISQSYMAEQYLSVKHLAERLDNSVATVWRWTAAGNFPSPVKLNGCTRWKLSEVQAWEQGGFKK